MRPNRTTPAGSASAPRVSVIIPCYNLGQYLDEAVDSVFAQTFRDFEVLIVDDGSTDETTRRVLSGFARPRARVVLSENRGLPAAKNLGIASTTGRYVCMLDADDRLEPTMLEKSVAVLDADSSIAFVSHWLRTFGDERWEWTPSSCEFPTLLDTNSVNGAALVRREAIEAVGGFDESMRDGCEDWDLWIALVERGLPGRIIPEFLFEYRRRPDSMSRAMMTGDRHPRLYRRLVEKHVGSYTRHLGSLIIRRERDLVNLEAHRHDLDLEHFDRLGPELQRLQDDIATLERADDRMRHDPALRTAIERARGWEAEAHRAAAEAQALRASLSWRMTAPARALWEIVRRIARRERT